jgi:hypothetical protein
VIDQLFDRGTGGEEITLAQFKNAGGGLRRAMRRLRRGVMPSLALFPLGQRFLHQLGGAAPGSRGKVGFLIGWQTNFHAIEGSSAGQRVKVTNYFNVIIKTTSSTPATW